MMRIANQSKRLALVAALLLAAPAGSAEEGASGDDAASGWGYVFAQCAQEPVTWHPRNICETGGGEIPGLAVIVSNIAMIGDKGGTALTAFHDEVRRLHGLDIDGREVGPFPTWRAAADAQRAALVANRRIEDGNISFLAVALDPARVTDEPNEAEAAAEPPPLPDVMAAHRPDTAKLVRTASSCDLLRDDGTAVRPATVSAPFGEAGEGCPKRLVEGYGVYAFDVERNAQICGDAGVCTEFFDGEGRQLLVADHSPRPLAGGREMFERGLVATGDRDMRLYSIPERRYLFRKPPFATRDAGDRVVVAGAMIRSGRPAVAIERRGADNRVADYALLFLDTRRFEIVVTDREAPNVPAPPLPDFLGPDQSAACLDLDWLRSAETEQYLRDAYYEFDKRFGAFSGRVSRDIESAGELPRDERAIRFARLGTGLDALVPYMAQLFPSIDGPADSAAIARLAAGLEFEMVDVPMPDSGRRDHLGAALLRLAIASGRTGDVRSHVALDSFLTAFGQLRYQVRLGEAGMLDRADATLKAEELREAAERIWAIWRDGARPVLRQAIFANSAHIPLGDRLAREARAMCDGLRRVQ